MEDDLPFCRKIKTKPGRITGIFFSYWNDEVRIKNNIVLLLTTNVSIALHWFIGVKDPTVEGGKGNCSGAGLHMNAY
jgi:hypothetical protein